MKILLFAIILGLSGCNSSSSSSSQTNLIATELQKVMAYGTITEANEQNPEQEKDLLIRFYKVSDNKGSCFVETHGVCQYRYYVSVATFDESPEVNVFTLSTMGEVSNITWLEEEKTDYVEILLTMQKYTQNALANNPSLKNETSKLILKIDPKHLVEDGQE